MTNESYTDPTFWQWVNAHIGDDPSRLRLASHPKTGFDISEAVTQVECRNRFGKKLARTLTDFPDFYFPSTLAGEQSTSDALADYHTRYVRPDDVLVDLTAGLGIDVLHLARVADTAVAVERNPSLCRALEYNAKGLGVANLSVMNGDCRELVSELSGSVAFIDPARRAADGSRVFGLADCEPDVTALLPKLADHFDRLIVKASPMLDIARTIADLPGTTDVIALGTSTECKELDILVALKEQGNAAEPTIRAVTILPDGQISEFRFTRSEEAETGVIQARRKPTAADLLYVPYPSVMKAAPVKLLSSRFGLAKFHSNTHLYFGPADSAATGFPGEVLQIVDVIPWQSKNLKRLKNTYPNVTVTVRNFGMTADALRAKLGVREGGPERLRLFGIGLGNDHTDRILVIARPLTSPAPL